MSPSERIKVLQAAICPISRTIMNTPIIVNGFDFDKSNVLRWLYEHP